MRAGNPALNGRTFRGMPRAADPADAMTLAGTVHRTALLLAIVILAAGWAWWNFDPSAPAAMRGLMLGGGLAALALGVLTVWKKAWSPVTAPLYAAAKGVLLGSASALGEANYPGVVVQAVALTLAALAVLLLAYRTGLIRVGKRFRQAVAVGVGAIVLVYVVNLGMRLLGLEGFGFLHEGSIASIVFGLFAVTMASMALLVDFDFVERGVARGADDVMEWFAAFGLVVTLVWLYLEMLRLLRRFGVRRRQAARPRRPAAGAGPAARRVP